MHAMCLMTTLLQTNSAHMYSVVTDSKLVQIGRHFTDDTFKYIFMNEKFCILIKISLKCVPNGSIDNNPALIHSMVWYQADNKPLSEPKMI